MTDHRYDPDLRRFINEDEERERQKVSDAQLRERAKQWPQRELTIRREERENCATFIRNWAGSKAFIAASAKNPSAADSAWRILRGELGFLADALTALPDKDSPHE